MKSWWYQSKGPENTRIFAKNLQEAWIASDHTGSVQDDNSYHIIGCRLHRTVLNLYWRFCGVCSACWSFIIALGNKYLTIKSLMTLYIIEISYYINYRNTNLQSTLTFRGYHNHSMFSLTIVMDLHLTISVQNKGKIAVF